MDAAVVEEAVVFEEEAAAVALTEGDEVASTKAEGKFTLINKPFSCAKSTVHICREFRLCLEYVNNSKRVSFELLLAGMIKALQKQ